MKDEVLVEFVDEPFELIRGTGNVWIDFDYPDAELRRLKTIAAVSIIGLLDDGKITVRSAAEITGVTAADVSRIRNTDLSRFTLDRLIRVLTKLDGTVTLVVGKRAA